MPQVSVVVAALDAGQLSGTVASLSAQSTPDWEAVLVGPWSATSAHMSPKIFERDAQPASAAAAFNAGLACVRGEWLLFLAAGETLLPEALEQLMASARAASHAPAVFGASYWREPGRHPDLNLRGGLPTLSNWHAQVSPHNLMSDPPSLSATLVRRDAVFQLRGFDETFVQLFASQFLTRLSKRGPFARVLAGISVLSEAPNAAELRAPGIGLDERLRLLDGISAGDNPSDMRALRIQAYVRAARMYLANGQRASAMAAFRAATACATDVQTRESFTADVIQSALDSCSGDDALAQNFVRDATAFGSDALKIAAVARLQEVLAFAASRRNAYVDTLVNTARAMRISPGARRNKGLWKLALSTAAGRPIKQRNSRAGDALLRRLKAQPSVFISPHFDDAPLSCGGLLSLLSRQHSQVTLLTVCTTDAAQPADRSPLAQAFRAIWGRDDDPYTVRAAEEMSVARALGFKTKWLGFPEAPCRYPRMRSADEVSGQGLVPRADRAFYQIKEALRETLRHQPDATLFVPLALDHLDHKLVHAIVVELIEERALRQRVLFYEDFPYASRGHLQQRLDEFAPRLRPLTVRVADVLPNKLALIHMYTSQLEMLFTGDAAARNEINEFAIRTGGKDGPCERYWMS